MKTEKFRPFLNLMATILLLIILAACNLPQQAANTPLPPTSTAAPAATSTSLPVPSTPTTPPTQQPTATPTTAPAITTQGFSVYDRQKFEVRGINVETKAELFKYSVSTTDYLNIGQVQMVGDTLFYFSSKDQMVTRVDKNGPAQLNFLPKSFSLAFAVSPDGKQIAWGLDTQGQNNPGSELWVANVDGSGAKMITSIDPATNTKWLVLRPFRWLEDGRLLFIYSPTGIGGYILFYGFAGISVYDPAGGNNAIKPLLATNAPGSGILCVNEISPDLKTAVTTCGSQTKGQVILRELATDKLTAIPLLPEQVQAGSPVYSPSGGWLAYAVARGQQDNESGKAAVVAAAGGQPQVIGTFNGGYVHVVAWVDENRLLLESFQNDQGSVWLVNRDGSGLVKLADGFYVGTVK